MDLSTIDKKLKKDEYNTQQHFLHDINRMISNSMLYHQPGSEMAEITLELQHFFEQLCL